MLILILLQCCNGALQGGIEHVRRRSEGVLKSGQSVSEIYSITRQQVTNGVDTSIGTPARCDRVTVIDAKCNRGRAMGVHSSGYRPGSRAIEAGRVGTSSENVRHISNPFRYCTDSYAIPERLQWVS